MNKALTLIALILSSMAFAEDFKITASDDNGNPILTDDMGLLAEDFKSAEICDKYTNENRRAIRVFFSESGAIKNKEFTRRLKGKRIAFIYKDSVLSAPTIIQPSESVIVFTMNPDVKLADDIINDINKK